MVTLLSPDSLEADAVVPQCLDNQYVSDNVFSYMVKKDVGYDDPLVSEQREKEVKTEFIRSLVYSSQVIVQRAFLKNNDFVYKNYLPQDPSNVTAFAQLIRDRAIVPFLFKENSLTDNQEFDSREEGDRALKVLLQEVGDDIACVRLAVDVDANEQATRQMSRNFSDRLVQLQNFRESERLAMARELFNNPSAFSEADFSNKFKRHVKKLAEYTFLKSGELGEEDKFLSRNQVYIDNFIEPASNVSLGNFKKPSQNDPFIFELKKYVDLVYNTNLPDSLNRYTFTPLGLPSRMALQDSTPKGFKHEDMESILSNPEFLTSIRRIFMARSQKGMSLPLLNEMSMADVLEVRNLGEWDSFKSLQAEILKNPLQCLDLLDRFQDNFNNFQLALSEWFNRKYQQKRTEERYCSYVSLGISLSGKLMVAGSGLEAVGQALADFTIDKVLENIPKTVKGYAVKLMISVYDIGKKKLDKDRSYSIEIMQTNAELTRGEVTDLIRKIYRKSGEGLPSITDQIADQGID